MKKLFKIFTVIISIVLCVISFNFAVKGESDIDPIYAHYRTQYYQVLTEKEALEKRCEELENQVAYLKNQLEYTEQSFENFYATNGDMNFDGMITISDIIMLYRIASGIN